jgi:transposase
MYSKIHQLKEDGLNKAQVERKLGIDYKTVAKYWDMTAKEFASYQKNTSRRRRKLDKYKDDILNLLYKHNDYKVSQIQDLLWENYPEEKNKIKYSTLRLYIKDIREKYKIPKKSHTRQYQAVIDPPMGYQAQIDLGVISLKNTANLSNKLYAIAMVLSKSRYKYVEWYDNPPDVINLIKFHENAFHYFKGVPQELVYDQDRLVIFDENYGDIIYTAKFEAYRQQKQFKTFICRSRDPESKGRVEAVIKYVKDNFAKYRIFTNIKEFNKLCWAWLERTGNAKVHGTTKKIPAEVFKKEQEYLRPVPEEKIEPISNENIISRNVRKDNTVLYLTNRYTVPIGTYKPDKKVALKPIDDKMLQIIDKETGEILAEHPLNQGRGNLIYNSNHRRDYSKKIDKLYQKTLAHIGDKPLHRNFLDRIKVEKPRYIRDQYSLLIEIAKDLTQSEITTIINYCLENDFCSAPNFKSVAENLDKLEEQYYDEKVDSTDKTTKTINSVYLQETEVRNLSEYEEIVR